MREEGRGSRVFIKDPVKFYELLMSGENHVTSWELYDEDTIQLVYKKENSYVEQNPTTNVVLAA